MTRYEAMEKHGLTHREWLLGETISVDEWRDTYQPKGLCFRDYPLPEPAGKTGEAGYGTAGMAGIGADACANSMGAEP